MRFESTKDPMENTKYVLEIDSIDLVKANFDKFDLLLLRDCESKDAKISDHLLALEMICRRIEEGQ